MKEDKDFFSSLILYPSSLSFWGMPAVKAPALGVAAAHLPWLSPGAAALTAAVRQPAAEAWSLLRTDPGAVLLVLRYACPTPFAGAPDYPCLLNHAFFFDAAARHLSDTGPGFVDWSAEALQRLLKVGLTYAATAADLAHKSGRCDSEQAWLAGLLVPLGWYAVAAIAPAEIDTALADLTTNASLASMQQRRWGMTGAALARRLARRWRLPRWLNAVVGYLDLPVATVANLGADPDVFAVVQEAVGRVHHAGGLGLVACPLAEEGATPEPQRGASPDPCTDPSAVPFLPELLRLAAENRRLQNAPLLEVLEADVDRLQEALQTQREGEAQRLQALKLRALAEFAAGAGHEINNPLAVISGQAQYLLNHENEPTRQKALQKIVGQAQRIHQILQELMQFARPARGHRQAVDVIALVHEVVGNLGDLAVQRQIEIRCAVPDTPTPILGDPRQVSTALACLLRNAIEAAPCEGWAAIRLEPDDASHVQLVIEDSGPGPEPAQREHLFDPFYSGRQAGRGRGLGLPTAWRLAQENGGNVCYAPLPGSPARFVIRLAAASPDGEADSPPPPLAAAS